MSKIGHRKSSGNIFADLGMESPGEETAKADLAFEIHKELKARKLRQVDAAALLGISQPDVSKLMNYRPSGFTLDRLILILNKLSRDVEIRVKKAPRSRDIGLLKTTLDAA